jgi:hypothetical protein
VKSVAEGLPERDAMRTEHQPIGGSACGCAQRGKEDLFPHADVAQQTLRTSA